MTFREILLAQIDRPDRPDIQALLDTPVEMDSDGNLDSGFLFLVVEIPAMPQADMRGFKVQLGVPFDDNSLTLMD